MPSISVIVIATAILLPTVALVVVPLLREHAPAVDSLAQHNELSIDRQRIVRAIRELDDDYGMGRVTELDYQRLRAVLVLGGAEVLQKLDQLTKAAADRVSELPTESLLENRIRVARQVDRVQPSDQPV